jgi:hypothetical protein
MIQVLPWISLQHGLLPTVTRRLVKQADLSQRAKDAAILSTATSHAVECRDALEELSQLVQDARLAETAPVSSKLDGLIRTAPEPLPRANIFVEIKVCLSLQSSCDDTYVVQESISRVA